MKFYLTRHAANLFQRCLRRYHGITMESHPKHYGMATDLLSKSINHRHDKNKKGTIYSQKYNETKLGSRCLTPWIYKEAKKPQSLFVLVDEANREKKIARSYKIDDKFLLSFCRRMTRKYAEANDKPAEIVDLFTGKPKPKKVSKLAYCYDKNRNLVTSKLVKDSISCIAEMPYNKHFFEYHISLRITELTGTSF